VRRPLEVAVVMWRNRPWCSMSTQKIRYKLYEGEERSARCLDTYQPNQFVYIGWSGRGYTPIFRDLSGRRVVFGHRLLVLGCRMCSKSFRGRLCGNVFCRWSIRMPREKPSQLGDMFWNRLHTMRLLNGCSTNIAAWPDGMSSARAQLLPSS
jgi:hypothetical protein